MYWFVVGLLGFVTLVGLLYITITAMLVGREPYDD